jgi:hypothetical protein
MVNEVITSQNIALAEKYLGLPTALGRSTKETFEYMPSRIKGLVGMWSGREATCDKMRSTISKYWWGGSSDNRHALDALGATHDPKDQRQYGLS